MATLMIILRDEPVEHSRIEELAKSFLDLKLPEGEWYYDFQDFMSLGALMGCAVVFHGAKAAENTIYLVADLQKNDALKHRAEIYDAQNTFAKISGGMPGAIAFTHNVTTALVVQANVDSAINYALPVEVKPREKISQYNLH
jgi:hypothetical protein